MINIARATALDRAMKEVIAELNELRARRLERERDIAWANKQRAFPHTHAMPRKAVNWCAELGMYVQENWEPRAGSASSNSENLVKVYQAESLRELEEALAFQRENPKRYDLNRHETRAIQRGRVYISSLEGLETAETAVGMTNPNRAANERFRAKQAWKQIPPTKANCLRCTKVFQMRKGTKYCTANCRKRHHKQIQAKQSIRGSFSAEPA
jgi:hypothetical protein